MSQARRAHRSPVTELAFLQKEIDHLFARLAELDRTERVSANRCGSSAATTRS